MASAAAALDDRLRVVIPPVLADSLTTCIGWGGAEFGVDSAVDAVARLLRCRGFLGGGTSVALTLSAGLSAVCRALPFAFDACGALGAIEGVGVCTVEGAAVAGSSSNSFSFEARSLSASASEMGSGIVSFKNWNSGC